MNEGIPELLYWNDVALEASRLAHADGQLERTGPAPGAQALATVHLAMYDAYVAAAQPADFAPYLPDLPPVPAGASAAAAVAGAAHEILSALFPDQRAIFDSKLAEANLRPGDPGEQLGREIAAMLLEIRSGDASAGDPPSAGRARHRGGSDHPGQRFHNPLHCARRRRRVTVVRRALIDPPIESRQSPRALRDGHRQVIRAF